MSAGNVSSPTSIKIAVDVATRDREQMRRAGFANAARFGEEKQLGLMYEALLEAHGRQRVEGI